MARLRRGGFTIVELMVVILIIALLMALLFPAVNSAREHGRRAECMNKMRELGHAVLSFESQKNRFPGWREGGFKVGGNPQQDNKVSWTVVLLPRIGRDDIYQQWLQNGPFSISLEDLLVCASDFDKSGDFATSYVANTGRRDSDPQNLSPGIPGPDWRANAVFLDRHGYQRQQGTSFIKFQPQQDTSFIKNNDGLGTTLMLSENTEVTNWSLCADGDEYAAGMIFWPPVSGSGAAPEPDVHPINAKSTDPMFDVYDRARPSSNHPGGVNVILCSGNGRFLRDDIEYRVYVALMTPKGSAAMEPGTTNPSNTVRQQLKLPADLF